MQHPPESPDRNPQVEYKKRLQMRRASAEQCSRLHVRLGNARLALTVLAAILAWLSYSRELLSPWWLLAPVGAFVVLGIWHERVIRASRRAQRAVTFYERGLGRLEENWAGKGEAGERFIDPSHPYAQDLDFFSKGGLFELLSTARTRAGEETLARWLLAPASLEEIRARHAAVDELRYRLDLREDLALLGSEVSTGKEAEPLPRWGESPPLLESGALRVLCAALAVVAGVLLIWLAPPVLTWVLSGQYDRLPGFGPYPKMLLAVFLIEGALALYLRPRVSAVVREVEQPAHDLALLAQVLVRIEQERFTSPRLVEVREALDTRGQPPSVRIARLNRLMELLDSRDNLVVRLIGPPLMWTTQLAFAIEAWRKTTGRSVRYWLTAIGEMGALSSLACYAYEHPADPFPEFVEGPVCFQGEGLGHPLIPESRCVRNDVTLCGDMQVLVVSGSNMSGKSTLLRTVGTNTVLAMAGAPVRAHKLRLTPLGVGASIRLVDSLRDGQSRFYAEIKRVRRLVDLTGGPLPLLFLLDELFHGTNSHDRRIGAEAVVLGLVQRGAIGMLTTHDLALAHIAEVLAPRAANVHFADHLENGHITFDYRLHAGIVQKSNALELMRSVGLEV